MDEVAEADVEEQSEDEVEEVEGREKREIVLCEDGVARSLGDLPLLSRKGSRIGELKSRRTVRSRKPIVVW